jgi:hypothetical protein
MFSLSTAGQLYALVRMRWEQSRFLRIYSMKYELKSNGSSKIGAALAALCAQGKAGETLVLNGVSQGAVSLMAATLAHKMAVQQSKSIAEIAEVFDLASIANASALKQALAELEIVIEDDKDHEANGGKWIEGKDGERKRIQLFLGVGQENFWKARGKGKSTVNLAALKDL